MAGGYQLLVSRAKVTVTTPDGSTTEVPTAQVSVRDGVARYQPRGQAPVSAPGVLNEKSSRSAVITLDDGTVWTITKKSCGCGGGR